jgi:hypothetical protein
MILFTDQAWRMVMLAAKFKSLEVAFFGRCAIEDGIAVVDDILIPPQEVAGAAAEMEVEQLDWLMEQIIQRGDTADQWFGNIFWGHSHVNMGTSPSGTDHDTLKKLAKQSNKGYALGVVVNQKSEATGWAAYRSKNPVFGTEDMAEMTVPVKVEELEDTELRDYVAAMMEHVTEKKYTPPAGTPYVWSGGSNGSKGATVVTNKGKDGRYTKKYREAAWEKYQDKGWASLTFHESQAVLGALEERKEPLPVLPAGQTYPSYFWDE